MDEQPPIRRKPLPQQDTRINHHISNVEWGLVIGALLVVDVAQFILDLFIIGAAVNRFIDIIVGAFLGLYVKLRCKNITTGKWIMALIATFVAEEIPVVDALPLWVADGFYNMALERAGEKAKQVATVVPVGQKALQIGMQRSTPIQPPTRQPVRSFEDTQRTPLNLKNTPVPRQGPARILEMPVREERPPKEDITTLRQNILNTKGSQDTSTNQKDEIDKKVA